MIDTYYDNTTDRPDTSNQFGPTAAANNDYGGKVFNPNPTNGGFTGLGLNVSPLPWQQNSNQYQNVGHDGSYNGMNREQWRDSWMSSGVKNQADTDAWLMGHGAQKAGDNGSYYTPFGEGLDLGIGYKTGSVTPGWTDTGMGTYGGMNNGFGSSSNQFGPSVGVQNNLSSPNGNNNQGMLQALQQLFSGGYQLNGNNLNGQNSVLNNALLSAVDNNNDKMNVDRYLQTPMGLEKSQDNQFAPVPA